MDDAIVGREAEMERIAAFVASQGPSALVIEGEAGIGKTTVWRHGVRLLEASGCRALGSTPASTESALSLSVLTDLLEPVFGLVRIELPAPQRHALDVALALAEPSDPAAADERVLRAATLSALRALARLGPVALVIDDCQWIDPASSEALSYALRRLEGEPIRCLFAIRTEGDRVFDARRLGRMVVEVVDLVPLSLGATQRLLSQALGATYPRPVIQRLVETSGGNPFYALELSRGLGREDTTHTDAPPALSRTLDALIDARLAGVSEPCRRLLGLLSVLPAASIRLLGEVGAAGGLDEAVAAGLVEVDAEMVRFAHPLLAAGAQARLGPEERRAIHASWAAVLEDPVERGRQLARATLAPWEETAAELEAAARIAFRRAQPTVAAELAAEAVRVTPTPEHGGRIRRRLLVASCHAQAGDHVPAAELLDELLPELAPGAPRAEALRLRAGVTSDLKLQRSLLVQALDETDDPSIRAEAYALIVRNHLYFGDIAEALAAARAADAAAQLTEDPRQITAATTIRGLMEIWGTGAADPEVLERAHRFGAAGADLPSDTYSNPHTLLGARGLYRYELDEARGHYEVALSAADRAGDVDSVDTYLWGLAQLAVRAGRYDEAERLVAQLRESVETYELHTKSLRWIEGVLATYRGRVEDARAALDDVVSQAGSEGNWFFVIYGRAALGFLELSVGDADAAIATVEPVLTAQFVVEGDPGQAGILPIAAEALIGTGDLERASALVVQLEARGRVLDHHWCLASVGRCHGLLHGATRDFEAAIASLEGALVLHERVPAPFERARTLLALGSVQARARKRAAARGSLEAAAAVFAELGAPLWARRAHDELDRVGGRADGPGDLTPHELRIARLVGEGKTNKEVAAALFVSDRTVESALTQIYRKLEVRSRTELARKIESA